MTADVEKVADYDVSGTPSVVVDGEVKSAGKVPNKKDVKSWFKN